MKKLFIFSFGIITLLCFSGALFGQNDKSTHIIWDEWGVPHIYAQDFEELFYAQGWAQMHSHANLILKLLGNSRGEAASHWGAEYLPGDIMVSTLGFSELADQWLKTQDPDQKRMIESFVKGLNDYASSHPEAILEENKGILPLAPKDILMHAHFVIFTRFVAGRELQISQRWPELGSNAYAIGPDRTTTGNAMLVQNPHLPWSDEFMFWENHLNLDNTNLYGSILVGLPGIGIGFNDKLGWTHTNNTIDNADLYELTLTENGYVIDGEEVAFDKQVKTVEVRQADGSSKEHEFVVLNSRHGPVVKQEGDKALAIRITGYDAENMLMQWWEMGQAENFQDFEAAVSKTQIPFWNILYADKEGNIYYLYNGRIPKRNINDWNYWSGIVPGNSSENIWTGYHSYEELPKLKNPVSGWLQNANDPPWTSTIPSVLNADDYPGYFAPVYMGFRPQRSAKMIMNDEKISFEELIDYKHSTHIESADRLLDDLFLAASGTTSPVVKEAVSVLEKWDRKADTHSKGMLLFYNWARNYGLQDPNNYTTPWNMNDPVNTPDGIADPARALEVLENAALQLKENFGKIDVAWGDYYRIEYAGKNLPANGSPGYLGIYRVAWPGASNEKQAWVTGGDSWVSVIEFGEKIKANALLSYGNSTQRDSPHFGDQLELFSKKQLRKVYFYPEDVKNHMVTKQVLKDGSFTEPDVGEK
ncbi:acylase [Robertkochia aurantiaca]|uniref:acylase n=1 Tax=Robertkochia aurantiaca TaxID=2873700 RepID=UPI001CCC12AF|nr:acylase [Robertkochia sp. 3YJGBD-33]